MPPRPDFTFPLLCFASDGDIYGIANAFELSRCSRRNLKKGLQLGMEMIEPDGRSWRVSAVRHVGYPPFSWRHGELFDPPALVEHDYQPGPTYSVDEIRARVLADVEANPEVHCHFPDDASELEAARAEVRALASIPDLYTWLSPLSFRY